MSSPTPLTSRALTEERRALVRDNVGLVGVHLRRVVSIRDRDRNKRNRDDLFQEGCLGLIRAAKSFDPAKGIPFRAYALARIRRAVHEALVVEGEVPKRPQVEKQNPTTEPEHVHRRPRRLRPRSQDRSAAAARDESLWIDRRLRLDPARPDSIGDRLRGKYDRAANRAAGCLARRACGRDDRAGLVDRLLRERFLVPERGARRPLREIARLTASSYGRVSDADSRLRELIRGQLEGDPEFRLLQTLRRSDSDGADRIVDDALEEQLQAAGACEFLRRFRAADEPTRGAILAALMRCSGDAIETWARDRFAKLSEEDRETVLWTTLGDAGSLGRD